MYNIQNLVSLLSKCLVAACRKETEARTTENLQELRDRILEKSVRTDILTNHKSFSEMTHVKEVIKDTSVLKGHKYGSGLNGGH
jgi:hypothetical protein